MNLLLIQRSCFNSDKNDRIIWNKIMIFETLRKYSSPFIFMICILFNQSSYAETNNRHIKANPEYLKTYMNNIVGGKDVYRNYKNIAELNRVAAWLKGQMKQFGIECHYQNYTVDAQTYKNVVCPVEMNKKEKIIIGAHYDVFGEQDGADDNASGVAGVLETARLLALKKEKLKHNVEFVFFTLEEPPYFRTEQMGSYIHAKSKEQIKDQIIATYILEMIGYYSEKDVQNYPAGLGLFYPKHGNFIAAISNFSSRRLSAHFCTEMTYLNQLQCERLIAPSFIEGIDFSDHANYWKYDIPAIMITDTAFFRNPHYHLKTDQTYQLNFNKMANVIDGVVYTVLAHK